MYGVELLLGAESKIVDYKGTVDLPEDYFSFLDISRAKLLQKSEMRKDIVIELSYKGFG